MKRVFLIAILVAGVGFSVSAQQKVKLGHINSNDLMMLMPGRAEAQVELEKFANELQAEGETMYKEYQTKATDFQNNQATMAQAVQQAKLKELQDMQSKIEKFQKDAQTDVQNKETELLKPMIDKAKNAIDEVAKENGFTYIFDTAVGALLFSDNGEDILPLVKKKLGIE